MTLWATNTASAIHFRGSGLLDHHRRPDETIRFVRAMYTGVIQRDKYFRQFVRWGIEPDKELRAEFGPKPTRARLEAFVLKSGLKKWDIHDCSLCGYACGYRFVPDEQGRTVDVYYDSGCHCLRAPQRPRTWDDVIGHVTMQTNPDTIKRHKEFWSLS